MRSWKTPALLATVGLCGLGSLFAQGPMLPALGDPASMSGSVISVDPAPMMAPAAPLPTYSDAPSPVYGSTAPQVVTSPSSSSGVIYSDPASLPAAPVGHFEGSTSLASPCATGGCDPAPAMSSASMAPQMMAPAPQLYSAPVMSQSSCGCQGGGLGGFSGGQFSGYSPAMGYGQSYLQGSGSGVASGLLTPNSNSGGLHTRYPYYSYRHPWFYQGPPSQNVTIVW